MSFIDCLKGSVGTRTFNEVQEQYDLLMRQHGNDESVVAVKLAEWWKETAGAFKEQRIKNAVATDRLMTHARELDAMKEAEWGKVGKNMRWVLEKLGRGKGYASAVEDLLLQADLHAQNGARGLLGQMEELMQQVGPSRLSLTADGNSMRQIVRGMLDGFDAVEDSTMKGLSQQMSKLFKQALDGYRAQGGILGDVDNYVPIKHNAAKIGEVDYMTWRTAYDEMVDRNTVLNRRGKPVTDEEWEVILRNMYDDITTNNATRAARELDKHGKLVSSYKTPGTFARRNRARLANPKNAEAFLKYNDKFGVGDEGLYDVMISSLEGIGRDTGLMQFMGPMPEDVFKQLRAISKSEGADDKTLAKLDGMYRTLEGAWSGSVDNIRSRGATVMHSLMSANLLGGASIAALADTALIASAKRLHGITGVDIASTWINGLTSPRDILRATHVAEKISHVAVSRFDGTIALDAMGKAGQMSMGLKNFNHRISGLERITQATGDVMSLSFFADLGKYADDGVKFADVEPKFKQLLQRHNITEGEWDQLMRVGSDSEGFITPAGLPDNLNNLVIKLDAIDAELRLFATNSPDLKTRYYSTGNWMGERVRGDTAHLLSSAVMQFKSFPVMVWRNHLVPSLMRAAQGDVAPMGLLMLQTTLLGAMVVQLKELVKGKPTYDLTDPEQLGTFVMKSMWQGGFAGLLGDALFKDPEGYRRSLLHELAGPSLSVTNETVLTGMTAVKSAFIADEDPPWTEMRRAAMPFVPLGTLWYTRLAFDRMVLDTLNAAADEDFYQKMRRRNKEMEEDRGSAGWWAAPEYAR